MQKKLSKIYINHSLQATSVTILDECRFEDRHISEHQNESSIRSYTSKTSDAVKQAISVGLNSALSEKAEDEQNIVHANSSSLNYDNRNVSISSAPKNSSTSETVIAKTIKAVAKFHTIQDKRSNIAKHNKCCRTVNENSILLKKNFFKTKSKVKYHRKSVVSR